MSNTLLTISMITRETLRRIENNLTFAKGVNREYDDKFAVQGAKIGNTLNIRKPARYVGTSNTALSVEDYTETSVPLVINARAGVHMSFSMLDMSLSLDEFSERVIAPAAATIANKIDRDGLSLYQDIYNTVGTPGTTPSAFLTYLNAGAKMDLEGCPRDGMRSVVIDPLAQAATVDALKGLFQSSNQIKNQYEQGNMGLAGGFKFSMDQNVVSHTVGPLGGTPLMNGATVSGATQIVTDGWTAAAASRLKKGDVITIANVFAVNPQNRQSTGQLRQFTVTADVSSDGSGNATIPVSPSIVSSGAFQTVNALPADNAALTVLGAANTVTPQNIAYHRDAFVLGSADLMLPGGTDMAARVSDSQLGLSLRIVRQYDINTDNMPCRVEMIYGWKTVYPELACRIAG